MNRQELIEQLIKLQAAKDADYGSSFSKMYKLFGANAGIMALFNKLHRLQSLLSNENQVKTESAYDSAIDMANYAVLLIREIRGRADTFASYMQQAVDIPPAQNPMQSLTELICPKLITMDDDARLLQLYLITTNAIEYALSLHVDYRYREQIVNAICDCKVTANYETAMAIYAKLLTAKADNDFIEHAIKLYALSYQLYANVVPDTANIRQMSTNMLCQCTACTDVIGILISINEQLLLNVHAKPSTECMRKIAQLIISKLPKD